MPLLAAVMYSRCASAACSSSRARVPSSAEPSPGSTMARAQAAASGVIVRQVSVRPLWNSRVDALSYTLASCEHRPRSVKGVGGLAAGGHGSVNAGQSLVAHRDVDAHTCPCADGGRVAREREDERQLDEGVGRQRV